MVTIAEQLKEEHIAVLLIVVIVVPILRVYPVHLIIVVAILDHQVVVLAVVPVHRVAALVVAVHQVAASVVEVVLLEVGHVADN